DQAPEFDGRARADLAPGIFGMMAVLVTATVIAILYFAREVFVPITLAVLLSFLLAPAVRWLRRLRVGRITAVALTVMVAFMAIAGFAAVVVGEVSSIPIQPANQNPFASRNGARRRCFPSRDRDVP
ncbi:MAG TPA: AI-2E family transporter, partial [Stellaceae bacterium]|nr:AI-2E family transporter [Stellaceae bacterium]